ncbi:glutathione hydrolase 1 proenzyme-like isoform X2 [Dendronephthya gigantea]|uniref:glutathione hydrolase 1 proenzyme-like isoform X2 n=1 Tax=Dendronephthya gigantea TaxID=151771 RepID=UPI00106BA431|nr:glutathione hydrolase 1 proenzyme-like isoform X2 [Dendronephthya gigantea]
MQKKKRFMMGNMASGTSTKRYKYNHAAVATDHVECSRIGRNILHHGGSAVDSAIAAMLCLGVVHPHSTGIGGGGFMLVYHRYTRFSEVIDFRENAPLLADKNMFHGDLTKAIMGGLAVGVPGELKGMEEAWKKYGKLPWKKLFEPAIQLAEKGVNVSKSLAIALEVWNFHVLKDKSLKEIFAYNGRVLKAGETLRRPTYARTLRLIAEAGNANEVYGGRFGQQMVNDINAHGGRFSIDDLKNYKVRFRDTIEQSFGKGKLLTSPPPTSGPVLSLVLNILKGYNFTNNDFENNTALTYHRIIEAFQMAYARRYKLGDPDYEHSVKEVVKQMLDQKFADKLRTKISDKKTFSSLYYDGASYDVPVKTGTTHLVVVAENGDTVSVTSTVNGFLGAKFRSPILGLIYNNEMDDFSSPGMVNEFGLKPAPVNFIQPGKRPQSSSAPVIILDEKGDVDIVLGASGGTVITTAVAQTLVNYLWFKKDVHDSISMPRLHHQLYPEFLFAETQFPITVLHELEKYGHKINITDKSHGVVQGIARMYRGIHEGLDTAP